ncbi:MAG: sigma-54-dependent Fis family transcriptional regulator [Proteobacteria bacterium]|nr:MAG: sigma-54-dependent Fis family transcriptional regulator [Pseudomonadota bacterium]
MTPDISRLLVIDDDEGLLYAVRKSLSNSGLEVRIANSGSTGIKALAEFGADAVLLDLKLADSSGLDVLAQIRALDNELPVIIFTAYSTPGTTIEATQSGAFEYLLKPVDLTLLKDTVKRAINQRRSNSRQNVEVISGQNLDQTEVTIIGSSPAMQDVYKKIGRFAGTSGNVLILGESGTGKDLIARAIHQHSKRRKGPFLAINCAALSETLLESELFGHERGAFTGADRRRIGKFEYASGGTILLDEIGDMLPSTQAKILRLLQEQRFERLGGNESITTDVRIVAATNKDLNELIKLGQFRADLFYRLNVFSIYLPPLRERTSDLKQLFRYFIANYKKDFGKDRISIMTEVEVLLEKYAWPGNMRELQSVTKHVLAHTTGAQISIENLPEYLLPSHSAPSLNRSRDPDLWRRMIEGLIQDGEGRLYARAIQSLENVILPEVLQHTHGNLQHACDLLGISRNTLKTKLKDLPDELAFKTVKD